MNEGILIAYDDRRYCWSDMISIEKRMTDILKQCGMKHVEEHLIYEPENPAMRDDIMYDAHQLLTQYEWIKKASIRILIINKIINIPLSDVDCSDMTEPRSEKYKYYEDFYKQTGGMAHDILIDENNRIVDGYISFLLVNKYKKDMKMWQKPDIYRVNSSVPHRKIVIGRHVNVSGSDISIRGPQYFKWIYDKKDPVVSGDILKVDTRKGDAYMVVEKIDYIAGAKNCAQYKKVIDHMGIKIKE